MARRSRAALLLLTFACPQSAWAEQAICPPAQSLPQLFIDDIHDPLVPVIDKWQIFWGNVPISDAQLVLLAGDGRLLEDARREMKDRGTWVYLGMLTAVVGTIVSSIGWVVFGANSQPQTVSLPMALGGMGVGALGMLVITESIQTPLEPHIAPTPRHRFTRSQIRHMIAKVNQRLHREICDAVEATLRAGPGVPLLPESSVAERVGDTPRNDSDALLDHRSPPSP